jgi:hypothetical protein
MQLHDRSGAIIGAVSVVFAYHAGADKEALHAQGEQIRTQLEKMVPDSASLFLPPK